MCPLRALAQTGETNVPALSLGVGQAQPGHVCLGLYR